MVYAIDFDGTLCQDRFPEIGRPYLNRIAAVKELQKEGHKIILWTCRQNAEHGNHLDNAVERCKQYGLVFDAVNENLPEVQLKWGGDTRKVYCDCYIDDKNYNARVLDCL